MMDRRIIRAGYVAGYLFVICTLLITQGINAQLPAFPGAEGFARYASGGRGGEVIAVTTLEDDVSDPPEGSLRWVLKQYVDTIPHPTVPGATLKIPRPLTVVFRASGIIVLKGELNVSRDNLTLAGQTAPGDGICFKNYGVTLRGQNIIIRYLRFRPGLDAGEAALSPGIAGLSVENCSDIMIDHCSFGWANEECAIFYDNQTTTVQWCIAHEGLRDAYHHKGERSYCGVWGGQNASYHHNLIAHNWSRTIRFNGARTNDKYALVDYRNNVIYNWGKTNACYGGEVNVSGGYSRSNIVNNYYKPGPATPSSLYFIGPTYNADQAKGVGQWYIDGNVMVSNTAKTDSNWAGVLLSEIPLDRRDAARMEEPFRIEEPLPTQAAEDAYQSVLEMVGAVYPRRDTVDSRIVQETINGTASGNGVFGGDNAVGIIDNPDSVGGYPEYLTYNVPDDVDEDGMDDTWELANGLDPGDPDDRNNLDESGYTMLEVYINGLVDEFTQVLPPVVHVKGIQDDYCIGVAPSSMVGFPRGGSFEAGSGFSVHGDSLVFHPEYSGDYELKYVYSDGEEYADSVTEVITVHPLPEASVIGLDTSCSVGVRIFLSGDPVGGSFLTGPGITVIPGSQAMFQPQDTGEYEVFYRYTDINGCTTDASATTFVYPSSGTADLSLYSSIRLYPNPAGDFIRIGGAADISTVSIYNIDGVLLKHLEMTGEPVIRIEGLDGGVYILGIITEKGSVVRRFVRL